ncbi:Uncharacterised protein [Mycobacteroides abscessus subsp. abscessus]|nr:excalibur domain-containing protein [Mycobacteroides abscessus subsp. abscessus]SIK79872.1 Uncharacterised protein [Mycobacteroides abscessus subsp. abscessus]SIL22948.1 Uncharacterised protein [Mycobacteroides abscessus subsp. abscessus]SIL90374.1 Uncharacterised protein [Mycobacteroides abscessus subsp. abscessus]SLC12716.1 Uncharacterised protein [Mycobacteroides abscessus subsp. abscessus]
MKTKIIPALMAVGFSFASMSLVTLAGRLNPVSGGM